MVTEHNKQSTTENNGRRSLLESTKLFSYMVTFIVNVVTQFKPDFLKRRLFYSEKEIE